MRKILIIIFFLAAGFCFLAPILPSLAAGSSVSIGGYTITPPPGFHTGGASVLTNLVKYAINILVFLGLAGALIYLIIGGIKLTMSSGDKQATASAKAHITFVLIGLLLLLSAFIIYRIIFNFFTPTGGIGSKPLIINPDGTSEF